MNAEQLLLWAQGGGGGGAGGMIAMLIWLIICVGIIAGTWKMFAKAGQPGWGCIIPFYNMYLWCLIAGRPGWWFILIFIPIVGLIVAIILIVDVAKNFGKGIGFALGMIFLGFIFYPILGFGSAQYNPQPH